MTSPADAVARAAKADPVVLGAKDLALAAAIEEATEPGAAGSTRVGESLGAVMDGERVAIHRFSCSDPAYLGWIWTVQVSRAPRAKYATVDDVVLLPGESSLLAPAWVPYDERILPGDLGVGDVLPTAADDPRLVLAGEDVADLSDDAIWTELGLGRPRVLSAWGRDDAAERWWDGEPGPEAPIAKAAPGRCADCGFYVRLVGGLGSLFGVCANVMAPDDGQVVAVTHGCGAHSEVAAPLTGRWGDIEQPAEFEVIPTSSAAPELPEVAEVAD